MAEEALRHLIQSYHELNSSTIDEFGEEPSPLEFMRFVARNRPFVVRGGAASWKAHRLWNAQYLTEVMGDQHVNVAITPHGNADSPWESGHLDLPPLVFVKPFEREELFTEVLRRIQKFEKESSTIETASEPVRYAQTQNDNLRNEYSDLFADVPKDIPFARIALQRSPEAINFWLGNSHSTTALHKDNYENIYVQILGQKHFVLLPPLEAPCVNEQSLPAATYALSASTSPPEELKKSDLRIQLDDPPSSIPFAIWDPDKPGERGMALSQHSQPLRVTLEPGDMLYLPALWYHKVSQSCSEEGLCCAVNYWYDMDFTGSFYPMCSFVRDVGLARQEKADGRI